MARIEVSIEIAAPANQVAVFFVPQRMPYWYGTGMNTHFEVLGASPDFHIGMKLRILVHVAREELAHTAVVTAFEWSRLLEWQFKDEFGVRGSQRWEIEPISLKDGTASHTRVHLLDSYELPGRAGRAVDWLLTRHAVKRRDRDDLARLKKYAEQR